MAGPAGTTSPSAVRASPFSPSGRGVGGEGVFLPAAYRDGFGLRPGSRGLLLNLGGFRLGGLVRGGGLDGAEDLADLDLVAGLDADLADAPGDGGGHVEGGLVGLDFEQRLVPGHLVAGRDEDGVDLDDLDVLLQGRQFDFGHGSAAGGMAEGAARHARRRYFTRRQRNGYPVRVQRHPRARTAWRG